MPTRPAAIAIAISALATMATVTTTGAWAITTTANKTQATPAMIAALAAYVARMFMSDTLTAELMNGKAYFPSPSSSSGCERRHSTEGRGSSFVVVSGTVVVPNSPEIVTVPTSVPAAVPRSTS